MKSEPSFVTTHTWTSAYRLAKCECGKQTTGILKNLATGKKRPFCSECAFKKGFR
jgi:hypothetical protein